jgi:ATP-dependent exoDNAse (exonuclease V) beta subunit
VAVATSPDVLRVGGRDSDRLAGALVHRLMQRIGIGENAIDGGSLRAEASRLLRPEEAADVEDRDALLDEVVAAYSALSGRDDVVQLYRSGTPRHEVPFTMTTAEGVVRGTIDCLIQAADGSVTILEFKTGRHRAGHEMQAALYKQAAEWAFPDVSVQARLIYVR